MVGLGKVRKTQLQQCVEGRAHLVPGRRTLPDQRKNQTKATAQPSRTLRPFIWPSVGWFLLSSPVRPSFFPEARFPTPACEIAPCVCDASS
jgi:hypothetical protein